MKDDIPRLTNYAEEKPTGKMCQIRQRTKKNGKSSGLHPLLPGRSQTIVVELHLTLHRFIAILILIVVRWKCLHRLAHVTIPVRIII